jgi:hypothetical protein
MTLAATVAAMLTLASGCGRGTEGGGSGSALDPGRFMLDEWSIQFDHTGIHAGTQEITTTNIGHEVHEIVIVAADNLASLPVKSDGSVDESKLDTVKVGEIADVAPGASASKTFDFRPGNYVVFCNVVDARGSGAMMGGGTGGAATGMGAAMGHVHYALGMRATFTVAG